MKVRFKIKRRFHFYTTLFACAVGIWLMVSRFGLSVEDLTQFVLITLILLVGVLVIAAPLGWLLKWWRNRHD